MQKAQFYDLEILLDSKIKPGGKGNAIGKADGDSWGAKISVKHIGLGGEFDFGWVAHFGETYNWCVANFVSIPNHDVATTVTQEVSHIWDNFGFTHNSEISAQACITPGGGLVGFTVTKKYANDLHDIPGGVLAEKTYTTPKPYKIVTEAKFTDISAIGQ